MTRNVIKCFCLSIDKNVIIKKNNSSQFKKSFPSWITSKSATKHLIHSANLLPQILFSRIGVKTKNGHDVYKNQ